MRICRYDGNATHFLARLVPSHKPIGTIRVVKRIPSSGTDVPTYQLGRLAVLNDYRKHRLGRVLVQALHTWVIQDATPHLQSQKDPGTASVQVLAISQLPVVPFYAK